MVANALYNLCSNDDFYHVRKCQLLRNLFTQFFNAHAHNNLVYVFASNTIQFCIFKSFGFIFFNRRENTTFQRERVVSERERVVYILYIWWYRQTEKREENSKKKKQQLPTSRKPRNSSKFFTFFSSTRRPESCT